MSVPEKVSGRMLIKRVIEKTELRKRRGIEENLEREETILGFWSKKEKE